MADFPFVGMRSTDDFATYERPENWRQQMFRQDPYGQLPLTGLMAKLPTDPVDDPHYHWWSKTLPTQRAAITGVYTNSALNSAYVSGGALGDTLYITMAAADTDQFRKGHQVLLRKSTDTSLDVNGIVTSVNRGLGYISVILLEADDNSTLTVPNTLATADTALIIGNANPEGSVPPESIVYKPVEHSNYTQIFRTKIDITKTAAKTRLRTVDPLKEARKDALVLHGIEMEKALLFGQSSVRVGENGKPERTTQGIIPFVRANAPDNVNDFRYNADFSGYSWVNGGMDWLDTMLELQFRYGSRERLAIAGSGTILEVNRLVRNHGSSNFTFVATTRVYGIQIVEWVTPFGRIHMVTHPLFSYEPTNRYSLLLLDPKNLYYRPLKERDTSHEIIETSGQDATVEGWLTEAGFMFTFANEFAFLTGFGQDNTM
jgi:hypothetical protein